MNTAAFKIGESIHVINKVTFKSKREDSGQYYRITEKSPVNKTGVIIGGAIRRTGKVVAGGGHYDDYDPAYLTDIKSVFVYQVRLGFINKPIEVLEDDMVPSTEVNYKLPYFVSSQPEWNQKSRDNLREDMKDAPRDSKGRWIPYDYTRKQD